MKEKNSNFKSNVAAILTYIAVCLLCGCAVHTGPRSGQVFNAVNNEPIQGAVVYFDWMFGGVFGLGSLGGTYYETSTDKDGKYYAPSQKIDTPNIIYGNLKEIVLIYKDGYEVCIVDLSRIDSPVTKTYSKKNNVVKLHPWKEGESHFQHITLINGITSYGQSDLLKKELEPEKKRAHEENLKKYGGKK